MPGSQGPGEGREDRRRRGGPGPQSGSWLAAQVVNAAFAALGPELSPSPAIAPWGATDPEEGRRDWGAACFLAPSSSQLGSPRQGDWLVLPQARWGLAAAPGPSPRRTAYRAAGRRLPPEAVAASPARSPEPADQGWGSRRRRLEKRLQPLYPAPREAAGRRLHQLPLRWGLPHLAPRPRGTGPQFPGAGLHAPAGARPPTCHASVRGQRPALGRTP